MPGFAFLPFPSALVGARPLGLAHDFAEGPIAAAFAPDGTLHVLSELFYNARRYDEPDANDTHGHYVTRFDAALGSARVTVLDRVTAALAEGEFDAIVDFALVEGGWLIMSRAGRSWLVGEDGAIVRAFAVDDWNDQPRMYRENFAARACLRPDGRLIAAIAEADSHMVANVIAVSIDPYPSFASGQPALRYLTSLAAMDPEKSEIPYVRVGKRAFRGAARPKPMLADAEGAPGYGAWVGGVCAISNATTAVAIYTRSTAFQIALIDDAGAFVTALDLDGETPSKNDHHRIAADQRHARAIVKTTSCLHAFDERGRTIKRVEFTDAATKSLAAFHLLGVSPSGGILLCHRKHRTLLLVEPTPDIRALPAALAAAAAYYKTTWAAAKKLRKPVNGRWVG